MTRYALLLRASGNRVYGASAFELAQAELALLDEQVLGGCVRHQQRSTIAGVDYLVVDTSGPLRADQLRVVSNLSSLHAIFVVGDHDRFQPVPCTPLRSVDEDVVTIQRYLGKTNEAFTHLLVNVALAAGLCAFERLLSGERLRVLDPACGRGTTLNRAAVYGMDACGVEIDHRDVDAFDLFLTTWLKDKRLKHKVERATLRKGRPAPAHRVRITYGEGRAAQHHRLVDVVHDDTVAAGDHFGSRSMDLLVCDLPYGVRHGSRPAKGALDRGPERLLVAALPVWLDLLKPGAGVALAWNRRTLSRTRLLGLVADAGFGLLRAEDDSFVHRVDRAITRDVLVATRAM